MEEALSIAVINNLWCLVWKLLAVQFKDHDGAGI